MRLGIGALGLVLLALHVGAAMAAGPGKVRASKPAATPAAVDFDKLPFAKLYSSTGEELPAPDAWGIIYHPAPKPAPIAATVPAAPTEAAIAPTLAPAIAVVEAASPPPVAAPAEPALLVTALPLSPVPIPAAAVATPPEAPPPALAVAAAPPPPAAMAPEPAPMPVLTAAPLVLTASPLPVTVPAIAAAPPPLAFAQSAAPAVAPIVTAVTLPTPPPAVATPVLAALPAPPPPAPVPAAIPPSVVLAAPAPPAVNGSDAALMAAMAVASTQPAVEAPPPASAPPRSEGAAQKRVALVIGNGDYAIAPLKNPVNDMHLISGALQRLNFEVIEVADGTQQQMRTAISQFGQLIDQGGVGLFYYAGHGMQVRGQNYLIPVDANLGREGDVQIYGVPADTILAQMGEGSDRLNIVVLDACRDNPFQSATRSLKRGLAQLDAPAGTLVAYATSPGSVASDGDAGNGLYTQELVRQMLSPNQRLEDVFINTRLAVEQRSGGRQTPWENASLKSRFYFTGGDARPVVAASNSAVQVAAAAPMTDLSSVATPSRNLAEISVWASVKVSQLAEDIEQLYLAQFPKGRYVAEAKARIAYLATPQAGIDRLNTGAVLPSSYFPLLSQKQAWRFGEWLILREPSKAKARVSLLEKEGKVVDIPADADDELLYFFYNGPKRLPVLAFRFDEDGAKEDQVGMRNKSSVSVDGCDNDFGYFSVPEWRDLDFAEGIEFDAQQLPANFRMVFSTTAGDAEPETRMLRRDGDELSVVLRNRTVVIPAREPVMHYKNTKQGTECTYR